MGDTPCTALGEAASRARIRPRHIVGCEDFTLPFWSGYAPAAPPLIWERREPVYCLTRGDLDARIEEVTLVPATERDLDEVVVNSAQQYREDLQDDRFADDPELFRERHRQDVQQHRWWILRQDGRIMFQVHRGPENDRVVQIGGVFTVPDQRNRGLATSGVATIARQLLETRPTVSLFCDEANASARRVYERIGFRASFHYRSWLLDTRAEGSASP
jgi:RimJ/RimL family protein N-acetyltransferase